MNIINQLRLEKNYLKESIDFWLKLRRYNASNHTEEDIEKYQYSISRKIHTIEKGMSMRHPRIGFGQQKVSSILDELIDYAYRYHNADKDFLIYPINAIYTYVEYTKANGVKIDTIENKFKQLIVFTGIKPELKKGGVVSVNLSEQLSHCNTDFESILTSRHSVRYFKNLVPEKPMIDKALQMAQKTPSACNRQGWKTHVFLGEDSVNLIKWQSGAHGFEEEIKGAILVTANLKAFMFYEVHQAYVDGGLYAMNLLNALHSLGFGTIPLSAGFDCTKLASLKQFNIPENEVPIVIIGFGYLEDSFNVAISERKDIALTNIFH